MDSSFLDEQIRLDAEHLATFGYKQELRRTLSIISNFAVAFSYISVSTGIFALFAFGLGFGGPAFFWSWPLVILGQLFVALGFAEMSSHFPIAGSIYQWTRQLANRDYAWFTGWIYLFASLLTVTSVAFVVQVPLISVFGWNASDVHLQVTITLVVLVLTTLINVAGVRLLSIINNIGVAAEILGMAVFALILLAVAHHQPASVITNTGGTGTGPHGYLGAFMLAMFMSLYVVYGFDTAGTLAEETHNPTRQVPKAILAALGASFVIGLIFLFSVLVAIPNVGKAMADSNSLVDTINADLPEFWAKLYLLIVTVAVFVCTLSIQASTIRLAFGMARDGQLPASRWLAKVSPSFGTPAVIGVAVGVISALPLIVSQQIAVIVAGATGMIYLAYLMCNLALLRARLRGWPERKGAFSLGTWGLPVNILAVAWGGSMLVNFAWLRAATNPVLSSLNLPGWVPGWIGDKPIFESTIFLIVVVGTLYYYLGVRPREAAVPQGSRPAVAR